MWSNGTDLFERLPSIDEDVSSGAVVFGNPEKKARQCPIGTTPGLTTGVGLPEPATRPFEAKYRATWDPIY